MALAAIRDLVKDDLVATDRFIVSQLQSNIPMIKDMIEYVLTCGGKRVRPLILLLAARALEHKDNKHIDLAAVIELIHTATLLHDDVVDDSTLRRGNKTAHTIWGKNASVLVGDFLYSRAFQLVVELNRPEVLDVFAKSTHHIAEGEILQLVNCNNPETTEDFYFDVIERKTARLFEISTLLPAMISTDNEDQIHGMKIYGNHLGLAYQLIDDVLDYSKSPEETGKNVGQDIAEGKTTLPLIQAMRKSSGSDLALMQDAIKSGSDKDLKKILHIIESTDSLKYTFDAAHHYADSAKQALAPIPASPYKQALINLCDFIVSRSY